MSGNCSWFDLVCHKLEVFPVQELSRPEEGWPATEVDRLAEDSTGV